MDLPTIDDIFQNYAGNQTWVQDQTIFICLTGSRAYGTNIEGSDLDVKGICCAPKSYSTGFLNNFEQLQGPFGEIDGCIFDVRKFTSLAVESNPSILEILWTDPHNWIFNSRKRTLNVSFGPSQGNFAFPTCFEALYNARWDFLSQEAKHRYGGYAISQLRKLDLHRQYLLNPPKKKPEREDFNLPGHPQVPKDQRDALEALMLKEVESWQVDFASVDYAHRIDLLNKLAAALADMKLSADDQWAAAGNKIGLDASAMEYLKRERAFKNAVNEWAKYQEWAKNRNPARAATEEKWGYDTKFAMHTIRLARTGCEILEGKGVQVFRPDREELVAIRRGSLKYDDFGQMVKDLEVRAAELLATTKLPRQGDRVLADRICQSIVEAVWGD